MRASARALRSVSRARVRSVSASVRVVEVPRPLLKSSRCTRYASSALASWRVMETTAKSASRTPCQDCCTSTSMPSRVLPLLASMFAARDSKSFTDPFAMRTSFGDQVTWAPKSQVPNHFCSGGTTRGLGLP